MLKLRLDQLQIAENRQRREFDPEALQALATSIEANGLLQPPVVRHSGGEYFLVAGERRLRALRDYLWPTGGVLRMGSDLYDEGTVPALLLGDLDPLAAEEAELEENIRRVDLSWQERAAATSRLASLRTKQAAAIGTAAPTTATIAEEVRGSSEGVNHETTRRELIVAQHLDNPEVKAAKNVNDAFKVLKRQEEAARNVQLAATVGRSFTADSHTALNAECVPWLQEAAPDQFDVILTDPPYGMNADQFGDSDGKAAGAHFYADDYATWVDLMVPFAEQSFRVAKPQAHLYAFCDIDRFHELRGYLAKAGWWVHRTPLVWHKPQASRVPWPEHGPQRKYELILYAVKGKRPVTKIFPDVLSYAADENIGHPAQKPIAVYVDLLKRSVRPGDTVLDPFCGSGTIFPACHELKCRATGIERDEAAYGLSLKRLDQLKVQKELGL